MRSTSISLASTSTDTPSPGEAPSSAPGGGSSRASSPGGSSRSGGILPLRSPSSSRAPGRSYRRPVISSTTSEERPEVREQELELTRAIQRLNERAWAIAIGLLLGG